MKKEMQTMMIYSTKERKTLTNRQITTTNTAATDDIVKWIVMLAFLITCHSRINAQSAAVKNVAKSVFTLTAYAADGSVTATSGGVFVGADGEAIGLLTPFIGAARAEVTDCKGNRMEVTRIIGMNEIYDVARFRVEGRTTPAAVIAGSEKAGSRLWLVSDAEQQLQSATVNSVETFMDRYSYYILAPGLPSSGASYPLVNDAGEVVGLMQPSANSGNIHATDASFVAALRMNALTFSTPIMQKINIPAALPAEQVQAQVMLMLTEQGTDTLKYEAAIADFLKYFPTLSDGYMARARLFTGQGQYKEADKVMATAIKNVTDKADIHFCYARLIYNKLTSDARPYEPWTLNRALDEVERALSISSQPMYSHLKAQILYSKTDYQAAYDIFTQLMGGSDFNPSELLFEAAQCRQMLGAADDELLVLLDSAVNLTDTTRMNEAAPFFLMRGDVYNRMERYREAALDYTRYAVLAPQMTTPEFYYAKAQTETNGRLYQQALADLARAAVLAPSEPLYVAELSSLYLRVGETEYALKTAERCIAIAPEYSTGHVLHGLALIRNGRRDEGLAALAKARDMGDEQAQPLIDKYSEQQ